ncbi:hypothetical protein B9W62_10815 [Streptomyces sp. CS113]|nr:hypothetical protein B9W62_10815 [Streptomyces sp. CS113]
MRDTPAHRGLWADHQDEASPASTWSCLAHTTGAHGFRLPHRSDGRSPQTPRGARRSGQDGRLGTRDGGSPKGRHTPPLVPALRCVTRPVPLGLPRPAPPR